VLWELGLVLLLLDQPLFEEVPAVEPPNPLLEFPKPLLEFPKPPLEFPKPLLEFPTPVDLPNPLDCPKALLFELPKALFD